MAAGSRPTAAIAPAALAVGPLCAACGGGPVGTAAGPLVLRGVTVIDGSGSPPLAGQTLVVMDGRITALGSAPDIPDGAEVLDLAGRWVIPGLIDTHTHMPPPPDQPRFLETLLAFGVTTARSTAAAPEAGVDLRSRLAAGTIRGPRFLTAGRLIDGPQTIFPGFASVVTTETEIRAEVRRQADLGVDFLKLYVGLGPALVRAAIDEAHAHGLPVVGHLGRTTWTEALGAGIDALTHSCFWGLAHSLVPRADSAAFVEFFQPNAGFDPDLFEDWTTAFDTADPRFLEFAAAAAARGVAIDPNLVLCEAVVRGDEMATRERLMTDLDVQPAPFPHPYSAGWSAPEHDRAEEAFARFLEAVVELHRRGVLLTLGSDTMNPWMTPGASAHRELELLVAAGLTPIEALRVATRNGALALGISSTTGTLGPGKAADLVVLRGNPTMDIANTRAIEFVIAAGRRIEPVVSLDTFSRATHR